MFVYVGADISQDGVRDCCASWLSRPQRMDIRPTPSIVMITIGMRFKLTRRYFSCANSCIVSLLAGIERAHVGYSVVAVLCLAISLETYYGKSP